MEWIIGLSIGAVLYLIGANARPKSTRTSKARQIEDKRLPFAEWYGPDGMKELTEAQVARKFERFAKLLEDFRRKLAVMEAHGIDEAPFKKTVLSQMNRWHAGLLKTAEEILELSSAMNFRDPVLTERWRSLALEFDTLDYAMSSAIDGYSGKEEIE